MILVVVSGFLNFSRQYHGIAMASTDNATSENPGDFFSAIRFVTKNDNLLSFVLASWTIGLALLLWKICLGSTLVFLNRTMQADKYETHEETMSRAGLAYKVVGGLFAALLFSAASLTYSLTALFTYGGAFFLVLWLFQVNFRDERSEESFKNRVLGFLGLFFAISFILLFGIILYNYAIPMAQHLGLLYSAGIWSILVTTIALIGLGGIFIILILLIPKSFELLAKG
jgi:vacuolar-type H+-ATPase subunit I/STV1